MSITGCFSKLSLEGREREGRIDSLIQASSCHTGELKGILSEKEQELMELARELEELNRTLQEKEQSYRNEETSLRDRVALIGRQEGDCTAQLAAIVAEIATWRATPRPVEWKADRDGLCPSCWRRWNDNASANNNN